MNTQDPKANAQSPKHRLVRRQEPTDPKVLGPMHVMPKKKTLLAITREFFDNPQRELCPAPPGRPKN
jgi:hypothetical protein